jgi:hypothetical protein
MTIGSGFLFWNQNFCFQFSTLVIGDEDACGAPKLLLKDVSFIKLQLFVVLNDMSV